MRRKTSKVHIQPTTIIGARKMMLGRLPSLKTILLILICMGVLLILVFIILLFILILLARTHALRHVALVRPSKKRSTSRMKRRIRNRITSKMNEYE